VNCSSCGRELSASDVTCPNCGQAVAPASATAAPAAAPSGAAAAPKAASPVGNFKFDRARWSPTDLVAGVATLVLFIALFLPWYGVSIGPISVTADGTAHGYMDIMLHDLLLTGINAVNLVLVVIAFLDKSGAGWRFGAFVGLIAAIVAALPKVALSLSAKARKA